MLILIKADLNNTPSIVPMCPTRWTVKWAALNAIIANYVFLLLTFEQSFREESKTLSPPLSFVVIMTHRDLEKQFGHFFSILYFLFGSLS